MTRSIIPILATAALTCSVIGPVARTARADGEKPNNQKRINMIPIPAHVQTKDGAFTFKKKCEIYIDADNPALRRIARHLAGYLSEYASIESVIVEAKGGAPAAGAIVITTHNADKDLGEEGYDVSIAADGVTLRGPSARGLFWGVQTLRQLLLSHFAETGGAKAVSLSALHVIDRPRYKWRGMHLDVGRHFMPTEFVKRYIDLLALHKMNTFHWHLTEDQGWRIEIKKYPKLMSIASVRMEDDEKYGGYYTQDEFGEVVAYAAQRFIDVVPEIEMPGHTKAALAAYPELSCTGGPFEVPHKSGIYEDVYCAGNEKTFEFLEGVIDEVAALFPNKYVHIGGDECPKVRWKECPKCQKRIKDNHLSNEDELQSYFIKRISRILDAKKKRLVGWDEILEGGLAKDATVMSWRGTQGGIAAARQGHDVVMCPTSHCYFDYRQSDAPDETGPNWAPVLALEKVYTFEPTPKELSPTEALHVLGGQGNVWTERMPTPKVVEYMAYPRACALAEVLWSPKDRRDWPDFERRLTEHLKRLDVLKVHYRGK